MMNLAKSSHFRALNARFGTAGGLAKSLAGVGARAHLRAISGADQVHGTMVGQAEGGKWRPDWRGSHAFSCISIRVHSFYLNF